MCRMQETSGGMWAGNRAVCRTADITTCNTNHSNNVHHSYSRSNSCRAAWSDAPRGQQNWLTTILFCRMTFNCFELRGGTASSSRRRRTEARLAACIVLTEAIQQIRSGRSGARQGGQRAGFGARSYKMKLMKTFVQFNQNFPFKAKTRRRTRNV